MKITVKCVEIIQKDNDYTYIFKGISCTLPIQLSTTFNLKSNKPLAYQIEKEY